MKKLSYCILVMLMFGTMACTIGSGDITIPDDGGNVDPPKKSGLVWWMGCGTAVDNIIAIASCPVEDSSCPTITDFYNTKQANITACKAENQIVALWIALDPNAVNKTIWNAWADHAKSVLALVKTDKGNKEIVEASLHKLVATLAENEKKL